jgi:hypothetical protein
MLRLLHSLPKPILFGLYGALGGLLGALVFGELIWALARPALAAAVPLKVAASPSVTVYWGGSNRIFVKIARAGFSGPVVVKARDLPADVTLHAVEIPADKNEGEMKITLEVPGEKPAAGTAFDIELMAIAAHDAKISDSTRLKVSADLPPVNLLMSASPEVKVYEGGSNRFAVKIARQNFDGPVRIEALDLPLGVQMPEVTVAAGATEAEVVVKADRRTALPRPQPIRLRGSLPRNADLTTITPINIMIMPAPPQLTVAVSPQVVLYPGMKNKFTVKIARQGFEGPVTIEAERLPKGVKIEEATIPAHKSQIEMEALSTSLEEAGLPTVQSVLIRAAAPSASLQADSELKVRVEAFPPSMNIAVSPEVNVTQGGKGKFTVKLARRGFNQPVQITFANAPDGTTFPAAVIPVGAAEVEVEMRARFKTAVAKTPMTATAKVVGSKIADAKGNFVLDVAKAPDKSQARVDIVFVLDVTGSMQDYINGIRDGIQDFVVMMENEEIDAQIGMVAFRDLIDIKDKKMGLKAMEVLRFDGKPFTSDYRAFRDGVGQLKADGGGDVPESSLDALIEAAKLPFRSNVTKVMILVTDAPPQGLPGVNGIIVPKSVAAFTKSARIVQTKKALLDMKLNQLHLLVRKVDQPLYDLVQKAVPGKFYDLPTTARSKKGFADFLPVLSKDIATTTAKSDAVVAMSAPPVPPTSKGVMLEAVAAPAPPESTLPKPPTVKEVAPPTLADSVEPPTTEVPTLQGVQATGAFAAADRWQLLIAIALWTAAVAVGISFVLVAGQKLYMSQRFLSLGEAGKSLAGGLLAGLFGGALGQLLFQLSPGHPIIGGITRILAWSIIGAILGGGMSLFVPNLRVMRSLLGGSLGGFIGAVGFLLADAVAGSFLGRTIGTVFVGFFIGMMVAFAELAFRRYWLEVAFGKHEIRTITLGATPITIGTHADAMIQIDAPAPRTFAFHIEGDRVICRNADTGDAANIMPGHQTRVGNVTVTMRSVEQARKLGFALSLSNQQEISLSEGMPLTAAELPGLEAQGSDGMVLLVSAHPRDPQKHVLRNRSKQTWRIRKPDGAQLDVQPGASIDLVHGLSVHFGKIKALLKRETDEV